MTSSGSNLTQLRLVFVKFHPTPGFTEASGVPDICVVAWVSETKHGLAKEIISQSLRECLPGTGRSPIEKFSTSKKPGLALSRTSDL